MGDYYCYCIYSKTYNLTYIGSTNNLYRRIRQHNGEIYGGAKATSSKGPFKPILLVKGFKSHIEALQFEWRFKHPNGKKRPGGKYSGINGRVKGLNDALNSFKHNTENYKVYYNKKYYHNNVILNEINNSKKTIKKSLYQTTNI